MQSGTLSCRAPLLRKHLPPSGYVQKPLYYLIKLIIITNSGRGMVISLDFP